MTHFHIYLQTANTIYLHIIYLNLTKHHPLQSFAASSRQQPAVSLINTQEHPAILFINTVCVKRLDVKLRDKLLNIHLLPFLYSFLVHQLPNSSCLSILCPFIHLPHGKLVCYLEFRWALLRVRKHLQSDSLLIPV